MAASARPQQKRDEKGGDHPSYSRSLFDPELSDHDTWREESDVNENGGFLHLVPWVISQLQNGKHRGEMVDQDVPDDNKLQTTSNLIQFGDKVISLGLAGLYGCTAVVVMSAYGAWMGHFWEGNFLDVRSYKPLADASISQAEAQRCITEQIGSFKERRARFVENVIDKGLRDGGLARHSFGVAELTNHPGALGSLFGNRQHPRFITALDVFIVAPRVRTADHIILGEGPWNWEVAPESSRLDPNANKGQLLYFYEIHRMKHELGRILGIQETEIHVIDYAPKRPPNHWIETWSKACIALRLGDDATKLKARGDISRLEEQQDIYRNNPHEARGKILLQYQPGICGRRQPTYRLWVEDQIVAVKHWPSQPDQDFSASDTGLHGERVECKHSVCPVKVETSSQHLTSMAHHYMPTSPHTRPPTPELTAAKKPSLLKLDTHIVPLHPMKRGRRRGIRMGERWLPSPSVLEAAHRYHRDGGVATPYPVLLKNGCGKAYAVC